jgi:hypothetical protein
MGNETMTEMTETPNLIEPKSPSPCFQVERLLSCRRCKTDITWSSSVYDCSWEVLCQACKDKVTEERKKRYAQAKIEAQQDYPMHNVPEGCSCHISAPCSFCVGDTFDEEEAGA